MGFRPAEKQLLNIAHKEEQKILCLESYRSSKRSLKRLAGGHLVLNLSNTPTPLLVDIPKLGFSVSKWVGDHHLEHHGKTWKFFKRKMKKIFNIDDFDTWSENEQNSFMSMAPLIDQIKGINKWSRKEKLDLLMIMRAKGSRLEKSFINKCQRHSKFKEALNALSWREGE